MSTAGRRFYQQQLDYLAARDIDGIVGQYHDDATLLGFDVAVQGSEALREYFAAYLDHLGFIELISTDKWAENDRSILFEATVRTALGHARVYDVFVLDQGRATHHFTGVLSVTPTDVGSTEEAT